MFRNIRSILLLAMILVLVGCAIEIEDPTAPPVKLTDDPGPTPVETETPAIKEVTYCDDTPNYTVEGFEIINFNYCLNDPIQDPTKNLEMNCPDRLCQDWFNGYETYSVAQDINGDSPPETASHVYIRTFQGWWEAFIQGAAGRWGLSQEMALLRGCYLLILKGETDINDRYHPVNFAISASVYYSYDDVSENLGFNPIPLHGDVNVHFPFWVETSQPVLVSGFYASHYGDAGENSTVGLRDFWVAEVPDGYCGR